jgi:hypothetical protein
MALDWSRTDGGPPDVEEVDCPDGKVGVEVVAIRPILPRAVMLFSEAINHLRGGHRQHGVSSGDRRAWGRSSGRAAAQAGDADLP